MNIIGKCSSISAVEMMDFVLHRPEVKSYKVSKKKIKCRLYKL